ncbi:hypothetical protein A3715_26825 [Oleiphilus sp. HI0009]|nr:hypothetical protein A3715_02500 [Oleiphilus sp. HI0009]KZX86376.1 hypothetical protein A3715_26825 [Oleiphilus sp. HI0009]
MSIIQEIINAWSWVGIEPVEIVAENDFGNLIIKDSSERFWRLCPEDVYCEVIANSIDEYNTAIKNEEFIIDWHMSSMVEEAATNLGALQEGYKYHMVIPGILGGEYGGTNVKSVPLVEQIRFSGDLGSQLRDLPDGAQVELKVID